MKFLIAIVFISLAINATTAKPLESEITGGFFASGLDVLKDALNRDLSSLLDKMKVGIDEWFKVGPREVTDNANKVLELLKKFTEKVEGLKPITYDTLNHKTEADLAPADPGKDFREQVISLIESLSKQMTEILNNVQKNAEKVNPIDETQKKKLLDTLDEIFNNAVDKFHGITKNKLIEMEKTMDLVKKIDEAIKTLYPKTTVGRTLYLETEKIVKQIEALLQMYITALIGRA